MDASIYTELVAHATALFIGLWGLKIVVDKFGDQG